MLSLAEAMQAQSAELDRLFIEAQARVDALVKETEKPGGLSAYDRAELDQLQAFIGGLKSKRRALAERMVRLPFEVQAAREREERMRQEAEAERKRVRAANRGRKMIQAADVESLLRDLLAQRP